MVNRVSIYSVSAEKVWISEFQAVQRTTDKNLSEDSESFRLQSFGFKIEPRDVTDVMWSGVDQSRIGPVTNVRINIYIILGFFS